MTDKWVLTWARTAFVSFGRKMPFREHMLFDSEREAVDFAMSLDDPQRRTAQLHMPDGNVAELPAIERMYAIHK